MPAKEPPLYCTVTAATRREAPTEERHESFRKQVTGYIGYRYIVFLPQGFAARPGPWPLVLFLHGTGERGKTLDLVKRHGLPKLASESAKFPFILVAPQCPRGEWWSVEALDGLLDHVCESLPVDRERTYVTGLSMGGYATWSLALRRPDRFAAIVPVCGGGNPRMARRISHLPVWTFHGARDDAVPIAETEAMVAALRKCGGDVRFTVYPDVGHDSWTPAYATRELYEWLLAQRRKPMLAKAARRRKQVE